MPEREGQAQCLPKDNRRNNKSDKPTKPEQTPRKVFSTVNRRKLISAKINHTKVTGNTFQLQDQMKIIQVLTIKIFPCP